MIINKWDTLEAELNFSSKGEVLNMSDTTLVVIVKKEGQEDEDALAVQILDWTENGKIDIEMNWLDERGDFTIFIKSIDWDKRYTLKEIPLTIK